MKWLKTIIGCAFLLIPWLTLVHNFSNSGVADWYKFSILVSFLETVPWLEWGWLVVSMATGLMLILSGPSGFRSSGRLLFLVVILNLFRGLTADSVVVTTPLLILKMAVIVAIALAFLRLPVFKLNPQKGAGIDRDF